jgi:hypothetical protein
MALSIAGSPGHPGLASESEARPRAARGVRHDGRVLYFS